MLISSQKLNEYKQYQYKGRLSSLEGKVYLDINHPWFLLVVEYTGDAIITPNKNKIVMSHKHIKNKLYFKQFPMNNPKDNIFQYFGTLIITKATIFGLGGASSFLGIDKAHSDFPEEMNSYPPGMTRYPEDVSQGNTFHKRGTLKILSEIKKHKLSKSGKFGRSGTSKVTGAQSSTTSGPGGY